MWLSRVWGEKFLHQTDSVQSMIAVSHSKLSANHACKAHYLLLSCSSDLTFFDFFVIMLPICRVLNHIQQKGPGPLLC